MSSIDIGSRMQLAISSLDELNDDGLTVMVTPETEWTKNNAAVELHVESHTNYFDDGAFREDVKRIFLETFGRSATWIPMHRSMKRTDYPRAGITISEHPNEITVCRERALSKSKKSRSKR